MLSCHSKAGARLFAGRTYQVSFMDLETHKTGAQMHLNYQQVVLMTNAQAINFRGPYSSESSLASTLFRRLTLTLNNETVGIQISWETLLEFCMWYSCEHMGVTICQFPMYFIILLISWETQFRIGVCSV